MIFPSAAKRCVALLILGALSACGSGGSGNTEQPPPPPVGGLQATPWGKLTLDQGMSCAELKTYVSDSIADLMLNGGFPICLGCEVAIAGSPAIDRGAAEPGEFDEFTGTNNQESGVDELDRVEADQQGNFYILDGRHLVIANGLPPDQLREIGSLELSQGAHAQGLLLDEANQRLVVALSDLNFVQPADTAIIAPPINPVVELLFINVADPTNPVVERALRVEGFELAARRIGSRVHLVSHFTPVVPESVRGDEELARLQQEYNDATDGGEGDADELERQIRARVDILVAATDGEDYVPDFWFKDGAQDYVNVSAPDCGNVSIPDVSLRFALTTITSIDSDGGNAENVGGQQLLECLRQSGQSLSDPGQFRLVVGSPPASADGDLQDRYRRWGARVPFAWPGRRSRNFDLSTQRASGISACRDQSLGTGSEH